MAYTSEIDKLERRWKENPQGTVFAPLAEVYRKDGQLERAREVLQQGLVARFVRHVEVVTVHVDEARRSHRLTTQRQALVLLQPP